jgi:hypothetical protein
MLDRVVAPCLETSAMQFFSTWLGRLPIGSEPVADHELPMEMVSFSTSDWEQLGSTAQQQGLAPLMYWGLSRSGNFSSVPESVRNSLRKAYSGSWVNNQRILKELEILAHTFKQEGIPLVVLKGACFALTIYPEIGLRLMGDLDILVPVSKSSEALRIAKVSGYQEVVPEASPGLNELLSHEVGLRKPADHSITLEIHSSLVSSRAFRYAVPVDWFWEQVEPLEGLSLKPSAFDLFMLTPTAQLLYAAAHAMLQHGGKNAPLRWFYDLDRLVRFYDRRIDWDLLLSQAHRFDWGSALEAALAKTVACFHTPVPGHVMTTLFDNTDRNRQLVARKQDKSATHILEENVKLQSLNFFGILRLTIALIAPSPVYMRWRYRLKNNWALPMFYLLRWGGIIKDGFLTLAVLLRRSSLFNKGRS